MKIRNDKLLLAAVLLGVVTACVNLPPAPQEAVLSSQTEPVAAPVQEPRLESLVDAEAAAGGLGTSTEAEDKQMAGGSQAAAVKQTTEARQAAAAAEVDAVSEMAEVEKAAAREALQRELALQFEARVEAEVDHLCEQVGNKLGSVSVEDCLRQGFRFGGGFSINQRPLVVKDLAPSTSAGEHFRVLLLGGIHGDEYSSISIIFKWLELFSYDAQEGDFYWRIAPLTNPDGLLDGNKAQRQNANGVDLNRNFPSVDWHDKAAQYWQVNTGSNPRRFPGDTAASEPEVQWIVRQIEEFQPDVIISVHAPYHLLDFDGPAEAPQRIGELYLHQLGVYPGSLGNYAGLDMQIPVVTLELPSAGILPERAQIRTMWRDLVAWLDATGRRHLASRN